MSVPVWTVMRAVATARSATVEASASAVTPAAIGTAATAAIPASAERPLEARTGIAADPRGLARKFALRFLAGVRRASFTGQQKKVFFDRSCGRRDRFFDDLLGLYFGFVLAFVGVK